MKTLYLIGGPMGVGKTTVCQQLKSSLSGSVFLDGDWCWDMHPFTVTLETKAMAIDNIAHLLANFLSCSSLSHIIFGWVMHEQAIIDDLLSRLPLSGVRVIAVSLVCSPQTLTARLQRDIEAGLRDASIIERSLARLPMYAAMQTLSINTDSLSIEETVNTILTLPK